VLHAGVTVSDDMTLAMDCEGDDDINSTHASVEQQNVNWLQAKIADKVRHTKRISNRDKLVKEMDMYMEEPNITEHENPFTWWAANSSKYPNVANIARVYLAVPATSVESERLFSKCGLVCSDRRLSLSPQHVEHLVFLSKNMPVFGYL
jgi:hypothetical protein